MSIYSGIFPVCQNTAEKFSERYLLDTPEIDLLACHQYYEKFMPLRDDVQRVQLEMLYPFFVERPWTRILKGKKVLVVHPFVETIKAQYKKRASLFENPDVLPDFELKTLKAVQTIAGTRSGFSSWFDALKYMEDEINKIDFDIAIIGCGAYGLPLAAYVKSLGKQAIHMASNMQILFGIRGRRWDGWSEWVSHFNEYWVYPSDDETPKRKSTVEGGSYWK
jgi:hypothetical protein